MRSLTAPGGRPASTAPHPGYGSGSSPSFGSGPGRRIWGLAGLITVIGLAVPGSWLIFHAGDPGNAPNDQGPPAALTRTVTVTQPVTSLSVESYGAPIQVTARPVRRVTVTEAISYDPGAGAAPDVTAAVSHGRLALAAPACATSDCSVGFIVTVPSGVAVTAHSDNGPVTVSGTAETALDSSGGQVTAARIDGPLSVSSENGDVTVIGADGATIDSGGGAVNATQINGPLTVTSENGNITTSGARGAILNSGGGAVNAAGIVGSLTVSSENGNVVVNGQAGAPGAGAAGGSRPGNGAILNEVMVMTGGGDAQLTFTSAPANVNVNTSNGSATLAMPGGPYTVTADSGGGPSYVGVPTSASARHSITVSTQGGALSINRN
jgi:hypothetical protein